MKSSPTSLLALGTALRDRRRDRGLTQQQLADLAGVSQPTVSAVERGARDVGTSTLLRLLAGLRLDLVLVEREASPQKLPWEG